MKLDYKNIENKIEEMIKSKIKSEGLVDTGALLNSIKVTHSNGNFSIEAEDYYEALDKEHGISKSVFNSNELIKFIEEDIAKQIEEQIDTNIK